MTTDLSQIKAVAEEIRKRNERMPKLYVVASDGPDHGWRAHLDRGALLSCVDTLLSRVEKAEAGMPTREQMIAAMCSEQWKRKYPEAEKVYWDKVSAKDDTEWGHFRRKAEISADAIFALIPPSEAMADARRGALIDRASFELGARAAFDTAAKELRASAASRSAWPQLQRAWAEQFEKHSLPTPPAETETK